MSTTKSRRPFKDSPTPVPPEIPIPSPGRELAGDQKAAFEVITARLMAGEKITKLVGYAGTGKTWLLARIAEWAKARKYEVTIAAPTHKAAGVIQEKLGADITVKTIHSLLGLRLEPDFENDSGGMILKDGSEPVKLKGLVICDEASMVGDELKARIDRVPQYVQWLFVGDLAQLPPVGEGKSKLLDDPHATLQTVLRQSQGSEILNLATRIRSGDLGLDFEAGKDVFTAPDAEGLFQAALERFKTPGYQQDAAHARMLVFRNSRRIAINTRMRQLLVGADRPYVPGEWLVMYAAFSPEKSRLNVLAEEARAQGGGRHWRKFFDYKESLYGALAQLHVSEEVRVESASMRSVPVGEWDFDVWSLEVVARGDSRYTLPVLTAGEVDQVEHLKAGLVQEALEHKRRRDEAGDNSPEWHDAEQDRKQAWGRYFTLEETFAQVDYAYCMTVHKSQGSTFDHVFVDTDDLRTAGGMRSSILYTACTRPAKSLTILR